MFGFNNVIELIIILLFCFLIYTRIKGQTFSETWEEIKKLFNGGESE